MSRLRMFVGIVALMAVMAPATPVPARTSYPTIAVSLGTEGYAPNHPNGWWRNASSPEWWREDFTSYCAHPSNGYYYGVLTNPHGYEVTPNGGYGDQAYLMYDPSTGWLRAANVSELTGELQAPGRIDTCRAPGAPEEEEPPPPPPPPPLGLAGGHDAIVGNYSCNVSRPVVGSSQIHLGEDGTFTVTPDGAGTASAEPSQGTEPRQGTWWSYPGDPEDRGGGVALRDGVFIHFQGNTSRFTIEEDRLVISGFDCTRLESLR